MFKLLISLREAVQNEGGFRQKKGFDMNTRRQDSPVKRDCGFLIALMLLAATLPSPADADIILGDYVFIMTAEYDYSAGSFSLMDLNPPWGHEDNLAGMTADNIARCYNGSSCECEVECLGPPSAFKWVGPPDWLVPLSSLALIGGGRVAPTRSLIKPP